MRTARLGAIRRTNKKPASGSPYDLVHERVVEKVLSTEVFSRDSSGGGRWIRAARFPAHKTLEEFDFTFQPSVRKRVIEHVRAARLPALRAN